MYEGEAMGIPRAKAEWVYVGMSVKITIQRSGVEVAANERQGIRRRVV